MRVTERFLEALDAGNTADAIVLMNGLSILDMLVLLDRAGLNNRSQIDAALKSATGVNTARMEYAISAVETRQIPAVAPPNMPASQSNAVENFLKLRRVADVARSQLGVKEIIGLKDHPQIIAYYESLSAGYRYLAKTRDADHTAPWCAAFVNYVLETAGVPGPGTPRALSVGTTGYQPQNWGTVVSRPCYMAVCILRGARPGSGHVGFVTGKRGSDKVVLLGGNQANEVNETAYPVARVVEYRVPPLYIVPPLDFELQEVTDARVAGSTR